MLLKKFSFITFEDMALKFSCGNFTLLDLLNILLVTVFSFNLQISLKKRFLKYSVINAVI